MVIPPFVVTRWVKTPLHPHRPWETLPNNPWALQLWVKTQIPSHCPWVILSQQLCPFWIICPCPSKELSPTQYISLDSALQMPSGKLLLYSRLRLLQRAFTIEPNQTNPIPLIQSQIMPSHHSNDLNNLSPKFFVARLKTNTNSFPQLYLYRFSLLSHFTVPVSPEIKGLESKIPPEGTFHSLNLPYNVSYSSLYSHNLIVCLPSKSISCFYVIQSVDLSVRPSYLPHFPPDPHHHPNHKCILLNLPICPLLILPLSPNASTYPDIRFTLLAHPRNITHATITRTPTHFQHPAQIKCIQCKHTDTGHSILLIDLPTMINFLVSLKICTSYTLIHRTHTPLQSPIKITSSRSSSCVSRQRSLSRPCKPRHLFLSITLTYQENISINSHLRFPLYCPNRHALNLSIHGSVQNIVCVKLSVPTTNKLDTATPNHIAHSYVSQISANVLANQNACHLSHYFSLNMGNSSSLSLRPFDAERTFIDSTSAACMCSTSAACMCTTSAACVSSTSAACMCSTSAACMCSTSAACVCSTSAACSCSTSAACMLFPGKCVMWVKLQVHGILDVSICTACTGGFILYRR